jgi:REP element-mobilizing transposase RayT
MPDHVHVFVQADHTTAPVEIAKTMKSISAVHIFNTFKDLKNVAFGVLECGVMARFIRLLAESQKKQ